MLFDDVNKRLQRSNFECENKAIKHDDKTGMQRNDDELIRSKKFGFKCKTTIIKPTLHINLE